MKAQEHREYGKMKVQKRTFQEDKFPIWTAVQRCDLDRCVARLACPFYLKSTNRCTVVMRYLKEAEAMVLQNFGETLTDPELYRVGMQLIPLYKQLARLKIVEMSLSTRAMTEETKAGTSKMHPVFKEIRECIRAINAEWREIGISRYKKPDDPAIPIKPAVGYYEQMEKDAEKEGQTLKLVKRNG